MKFLKDNWLWIVLPVLLAAAVMAYVVFFGSTDPLDEFIYSVG